MKLTLSLCFWSLQLVLSDQGVELTLLVPKGIISERSCKGDLWISSHVAKESISLHSSAGEGEHLALLLPSWGGGLFSTPMSRHNFVSLMLK